MTEDFLKKTEEVEKLLFEIFGNKVFASFVHLIEREKIWDVWARAVAVFTHKFNSLRGDKKSYAEKILKEYANAAGKIKLQKQWFRQDEIDALFEKSKELHPYGSSFLKSLLICQLKRLEEAKKLYGGYALKNILTLDTIQARKFMDMKVERPDSSVIFPTDVLERTESGEFDLDTSAKRESKEHNLVAMMTAYSYIPSLQDILLREIKTISDNPIVYSLYKESARKILWAATKYLVEQTSKFVYNQIASGLSVAEARENAIEFFKTLPEKDPQMLLIDGDKNIWIAIREAAILGEKMSEKDSKSMFMDALETVVYLCRTGLCIADTFYKGTFRNAVEDEMDFEGNEFSFDISVLDEDGSEIEGLKETYSITYDPKSWIQMFSYCTQGRINPNLYPSIKDKTFLEKVDEFFTEPLSDFLKPRDDYSKFIDENTFTR